MDASLAFAVHLASWTGTSSTMRPLYANNRRDAMAMAGSVIARVARQDISFGIKGRKRPQKRE